MPDKRTAPGAAAALGRKRRLHPLAILNPFGGYVRPPRLGWRAPNLKPIALAILGVAILWIDYASDSVTVTDDGGILIQRTELTWVDGLVLVAGLGVLVACIARWWTFRWWVDNNTIHTTGGVLHRWMRGTTFDHIVTVDHTTTPLKRLFRVSSIAIETTAMHQAAPDILLGYLSRRDARLLEHLLVSRLLFHGDEAAAQRPDPTPLGRLGWRDLIMAGATTIQVTRALVTLWATSQVLAYIAVPTPTLVFDSETGAYGLSPMQFGVVFLVGTIAVLWLTSAIYFIVSFARFRLGRHEGWLTVETGVLRPVRRLIRIDAIQGLEVSRSPLQRRFRGKRAMLLMRMPAYGAPPNYAMVLHPAVTDAAIPELTKQIIGMDAATSRAMCGQGIHRLAAGSRVAYIVSWPTKIAAASGALLLLLLILQRDLWWWALTPLPLTVPLAYLGLLAWRSAGWYADNGDWLVIQRGALRMTSTAARVDRIQYLQWSLPMLSRSPSSASMAVSVATSGGAGMTSRIQAWLHRPVNPSIVRLRTVDAAAARAIAVASGYGPSLPPALAVE
jgi:putative membrane protein